MNQTWIPNRGKRLESLKRFLHKPWPEKVLCIKYLCLQVFGVLPLRLPLGGWWLVYNDNCGNKVLDGRFENAEFHFVAGLLGPGMTALDIGAHHGFYTL